MSDGATVWAVYDADNFECGGISSLHWSYEGAQAAAKVLVAKENTYLASHDEIERYPKEMEQLSPDKWYWRHRTIEVAQVKVNP